MSTCQIPLSHSTGLGVIPPASQLSSIPIFNTLGISTTSTSPISSIAVNPTSSSYKAIPSAVNASTFQDLPLKLAKRILSLEFVDMAELIPESWKFIDEDVGCCHHNRASRKGPVTDILLWVECYSTLVAVLASQYPTKIPQLMVYQKTIVKAHKTYIGQGWVTYDTCYRRKAANTKCLDWDVIDFNLYNETFAGRAKVVPRYLHCSSEFHSSAECVQAPDYITPHSTSSLVTKKPVQYML